VSMEPQPGFGKIQVDGKVDVGVSRSVCTSGCGGVGSGCGGARDGEVMRDVGDRCTLGLRDGFVELEPFNTVSTSSDKSESHRF